ncbi:MAG: peptide ABC transporter substrate-binding protein [Chloroflexota bacterium]|nr:peptide ABC transporter substrate-binding protein [Chloroflexia bacterium]MDQ3443273.1 peptide ABC transporter substrate-binding protein [Chloroflexota bacterium]
MSNQGTSGPFRDLFTAFKGGNLSRRQFIERATALGMSAGLALHIAGTTATAQEGSPAAGNAEGSTAPAVNTENQERGSGGELRILQWQAPSHLSAHQATGDKDGLGASLVSEPLMFRGPDAGLIPVLITQVPTVENGQLAEDFTSVTFSLKEGIVWSDGEPFTASDVVFTLDWIRDTANNAVSIGLYESIDSYEAIDDLTVTITYSQPNPTWSDGFTGAGASVIYPRHIMEGGGQEVNDAFKSNPIGTGPYKVESFNVNDQAIYVVNENYREPNKPYFERVLLKGGGDAASAARAVIQTGEYDFGWNIAIEPEIASSFESDDSPGVLLVNPDISIERININFSDPRAEVDGQRSEMNTPHPIFSDLAVRQAMNLGINRQQIADSFFFGGDQEPPVVNIISGIEGMESPNNEVVYDPEAAGALLDETGWVMDGDVRKKDGVELSIDFMTTVSQLRQKIQAVAKSNLEVIGFKVELKQVDSGVFFDSAEGNDQNNTHFYNDLNMFTSSIGAPPPVAYMIRWYAGPDGENIAQASNAWTGRNFQRYNNPEYDALYESAQTESDPDSQNELFISMNDLLFNDAAVLPLVRIGSKVAAARTLNVENLASSPYEFDYWNIANWNRNAE